MSRNIKFNKSMLAVVISSALLSACGGDDTNVEPAQVNVPETVVEVTTPAVEVTTPATVIEAPAAIMATVSGSVVNGKTRASVTGLNVQIHMNGQTFETQTDDNGSYTLPDLAINSDYLLVVSDETGAMAPAYYNGTTGEAGQVLQAVSVFNAVSSSITLNDVSAGNLSGATLYVSGNQLNSTGLSAKGYMVNTPDLVATEENGVYTFTLPDDGTSYAVSTSSMGGFSAVDGSINAISAGDAHVEHVISATAAAAAEHSFNFNLTDADGMAVFAGDTIEIMVAGNYYTATATGQGSYSATVGIEALNSSSVVITTTGATLPVSMEELIANPSATYNVTVSEETIAQLEDEGQIAEFSASVISSSLVENDEFQVVVKFSHPTELISDVVDTHSTVSLEGSMWDMSAPIGASFTDANGNKATKGQGWHAADTEAGSVLSGYSYEIPFGNKGVYETPNPLNINNYSSLVWPSEYNGKKSPQTESYFGARNKAGVGFAMSGLDMSLWPTQRVPYANEHPDNDPLDLESPKYDFDTEHKSYWNKALHTVKFVVEEGEVTDFVTYYKTDEDVATTVAQDVMTDQGRITGYYDASENEMEDTLTYSWNADNTVLTITGDASALTAGIEHSIVTTALSLHDNSNIDIMETFVASKKAMHTLDDVVMDNSDYLDNTTATGYNLETASNHTADSNGAPHNPANTAIQDEQRVSLDGITYNGVGSTWNYDAYYTVGGSGANYVLAGYKDYYAGYNQAAVYSDHPATIVSPVMLDGYMNITSVRMMYALKSEGGSSGPGTGQAAPNWAEPIFEDVAVSDLRVQFGDSEVTGAQTLTPNKVVMTDRSAKFTITADAQTDLESVYGEGVKYGVGFNSDVSGDMAYYYELPFYTDSGQKWAKPEGYESPVLMTVTAEVNVTIDGKMYKETKTFNVR